MLRSESSFSTYNHQYKSCKIFRRPNLENSTFGKFNVCPAKSWKFNFWQIQYLAGQILTIIIIWPARKFVINLLWQFSRHLQILPFKWRGTRNSAPLLGHENSISLLCKANPLVYHPAFTLFITWWLVCKRSRIQNVTLWPLDKVRINLLTTSWHFFIWLTFWWFLFQLRNKHPRMQFAFWNTYESVNWKYEAKKAKKAKWNEIKNSVFVFFFFVVCKFTNEVIWKWNV